MAGSRRRAEAVIVVDGHELSDDQAGSLRVALAAFIRDLQHAIRRAGDTTAAERTLTRCREIHRFMEEARVG